MGEGLCLWSWTSPAAAAGIPRESAIGRSSGRARTASCSSFLRERSMSLGVTSMEGVKAGSALPPGVKLWRQKKLRDEKSHENAKNEYDDASFIVRDREFLDVLGPNPTIEKVADTDAHEGLIYYPDQNALLFTTQGDMKNIPNKVKKVCLKSNKVEVVFHNTEFANGMTLDLQGNVLICQQGCEESPAYIERVELRTCEKSNFADNWFGRRFNGPNDIVVKSDGSVWFTDPDYPREQGFGGKPELKNHVYRITPDGLVDVIADKFFKPNGLAFSPDESKLYVTDTGFSSGFYDSSPDDDRYRPHSITVFDVLNGGRQLGNRRLFASICNFDGSKLGSPDGIKVDTAGRVYVGNADGVHVIREDGVGLGLIRVPESVNFGFGGAQLDTLYVVNDQAVYAVKLKATGAGLFYAGQFHRLPFYTRN